MKSRIMIVEPSLTMLYLLEHDFRDSSYQADCLSSFEKAQSRFEALPIDSEKIPQAVIVDWPLYPTDASDELLTAFESAEHRHLPVIVLSQEVRSDARAWVAQRPNTTFVLWENHDQLIRLLDGLLGSDEDLKKDRFSSKFANDDIRILVVDDSPSVRVSLRKLLTLQGYRVEVCATGDDALNRAQSGNFDIAVIDFYLVDETGDDVCRKIMTDDRSQRTICTILTGTYSDSIIKKCLRAGAVECMFKDESSELLLARLDAISRVVRAQKNLREDRQRLDEILSAVHDGVYGVNHSGELTFMNRTAKKMLGYAEDDNLLGRLAHELFHHSDSLQRFVHLDRCHIQYAYEHGVDVEDMDGTFFDVNGNTLEVNYSIRPLRISGSEMGSIVVFSKREDRRGLEDQVWERLAYDELTGLMNRRYFESCLQNEIHRTRRAGFSDNLLVLNIEFSVIGGQSIDEVSHRELLHTAAQTLSSRFRSSDYLSYFGKGLFGLVLANNSEESASLVVGQLIDDICARIAAGGHYRANCSGGLVAINDGFNNSAEMINMALLATQMAKRKGHNYLYICATQQFIHCDSVDKTVALPLHKNWRRAH